MLDWIVREGPLVLGWWLLVTLAGAAALPLCWRLLGGLPDKGYTLARAAGLLVVGFVFWLFACAGFLRNAAGDMVLSWLITLGLAVVVYRRFGAPVDIKAWWRENRTAVIAAELLFAVMLFGWALVRAHQNGLTGTEKPMELMFISAVQRSEAFPPNDAWMAGYAISYYYFGYVMAGMLATLSGVASTTAFNLTAALLFAMTGLGVFGVVYNLVRSRAWRGGRVAADDPSRKTAIGAALLGVVFVVFMSNFEMLFVEIPYRAGASEAYLRFWNVDDRQIPLGTAGGPSNLDPATWGHWWWWPASRVVNDLNLAGGHIEVIDEFPNFSFVLGDNHPHVLALPVVMLALGMALNLLLVGRAPTGPERVFYGLCIGGLAFLNTWDGPLYLLALLGADGLRRAMREGRGRLSRGEWGGLAFFGIELLVLAFFFYLPFWLGFRSQAGGILPNVLNPTTTPQFFLMFGPFLLLLAPFLIVEVRRAGGRMNWSAGLTAAVGLLIVLVAAMLVLIGVGSLIPALRSEALRFVEEAGGWDVVLPVVAQRRLESLPTALLMLAGIALVVGRLVPRLNVRKTNADDAEREAINYAPATGFALMLVGLGLFLALTPEFLYLRDNFGTRMNTIFKFYYQAWILFSVAAAYGAYTLIADERIPARVPVGRLAYVVLLAAVLGTGLLYPLASTYHRMFVETGRASALSPGPLTLDGGRTFTALDDYEAIMCLNQMVEGDDVVVAEAIGPAYRSEYGRVGALTGLPILLGWENHEGQWRGPTYSTVVGARPADIPRLYQDPRWEVAQGIINAYGIDYIFFGQTERSAYGVSGEDKFRENMDVVCERGTSRFYRVRPVQVAEAR